jgi:sulfite exporter TauE/SafE
LLPPSLNEVLNYTTPVAAILLAAGSLLHCSLMCGPIAAATMNTAKSVSSRKWHFFQYQLGRSFAYSVAGLAAASVGHVLRPSPIAVGVFLVVVLTVVIVQLFQITLPSVSLVAYSRFVRPLQRLKPIGKFQSLGLGLLTPLIPCGQLWMVFGFSALATSPAEGAALAFGFSVFSAPGVYGFSFLKEQLLKLSVRQPNLIKVCLRSAIVFVLALSAVKYSSLLSQTSQAEAKSSSPTNLICH